MSSDGIWYDELEVGMFMKHVDRKGYVIEILELHPEEEYNSQVFCASYENGSFKRYFSCSENAIYTRYNLLPKGELTDVLYV